jgi:prolyl-tRNA synthetase
MEKREFEKKELAKKTEDFSKWYTDVILKSGLAEYAPVKGCQIIKPYGFSLWENVQRELDKVIKATGAKNAYFPLFIPESFLEKEKKHVKGFSPELAVVTIGGGKKLKEKLIVRPTSETVMYKTFAGWIDSWRDLPLLINQWANIVRWEKRPRLFLRTTEFLWQEGHTAHRTHKESSRKTIEMIKIYANFYKEFFALDGVWGRKSESEKFPGALETYTFEMLMPSGLALQGCTSHDLGQNFAKVFEIKFKDKDRKEKFVWQTSWGLSTRSIGAMIMVHGDNQGLIIPPRLAPIQVVVVPIFQKRNASKLKKKLNGLKKVLSAFRVEIDAREDYSVGWKFNEWELKGVPLRIEIGQKELSKGRAKLVRRDNRKSREVSFGRLDAEVQKELEAIQQGLYKRSKKFLRENIREAKNYKEFKEIMKKHKGFIRAFWCEDSRCEEKIKSETKATTRCLPHNAKIEKGKCVLCGKRAERKWLFAQAY